jgi:hypothetical protein
MAMDEETIIKEILAHVKKEGGPTNSWYAGITSDIKTRLHETHGVPEKDYWFIYRHAESSDIARKIEKKLLDTLGFDGGPGGGNYDCTTVYCYKKSSITDP